MTPKRIQRKRTKGWRMPEGAIYVGRPTKWGNPWAVHQHTDLCGDYLEHCPRDLVADTRRDAVRMFRYAILFPLMDQPQVPGIDEIRAELAGHDLACWCPLDDEPCHADVLLEIANTA